jgi:hypothetical protein
MRRLSIRFACQTQIRAVIMVSVVALLSGCATQYKPRGWTGGYDDFRISEDAFEVTFKGNGYTASETVSRYVFRRASEVTLSHGFTHFLPLSEMDRSRFGTIYHSSGHATAHMSGNTAYGYGTSTGYSSTIKKPGTTMRIRCFKDPLPDVDDLIDAHYFLEHNYPESMTAMADGPATDATAGGDD